MKTLILFSISCLFFSFTAKAESDLISEIQERNDQKLEKLNESIERSNKKIQEISTKIKEFDTNKKQLSELVLNYESNRQKIIIDAEEARKRLSFFKRKSSPEARFYLCVQNELKNKEDDAIKKCSSQNLKLNDNESELVEKWVKLISRNPEQLEHEQEIARNNLIYQQEMLLMVKKNSVEAKAKFEKQFQLDLSNAKVLKSNPLYLACDDKTPEIDLEKEVPYPEAKFIGPFLGVPQDNQDGLGTCYSNTAKNLLVGLSGGKDIASFLDLAVLYKSQNKSQNDQVANLNGGSSCETLEVIKEKGYCPQNFSPFETGENHKAMEGLLTNVSGLHAQSVMIHKLSEFIKEKNNFQELDPELANEVMANGKFLINSIKSQNESFGKHKQIRQIPSKMKIIKISVELEKTIKDFSHKKFVNSYGQAYQKFYPAYLKALLDGKNKDEIFDLYKDQMKSFIEEYKLSEHLPNFKEEFLKEGGYVDLSDAFDISPQLAYADPKFKQGVASTMAFLKQVSGKEGSSDEELLSHCEGKNLNILNILNFVDTLESIVKTLMEGGVNVDYLYDKNGRFRDYNDLMQLATAPECVDDLKRVKIDYGVVCIKGADTIRDIKMSDKNIKEQEKELRSRVIASLLQGYPLGNGLLQPGSHINTIVGMRFNPTTKKCEYKIRESQIGESIWQEESEIFERMVELTEVRRE